MTIMYLFNLCRERVSINWEVSQLMFRDSAFTQGLIEPQAGIMTLKSKGAGEQEKWKNKRGNRMGGWGGGFPQSFHLFIFHRSDGSVWWRNWLLWDFTLFSAIRAPDKRWTSKWSFFHLNPAPPPPSPRLPPLLSASSAPFAFFSLSFSISASTYSGRIRFSPWKWDSEGLSSSHNAEHALCVVSVSLSGLRHFYSMHTQVQA